MEQIILESLVKIGLLTDAAPYFFILARHCRSESNPAIS
jgi:hypothetical protein